MPRHRALQEGPKHRFPSKVSELNEEEAMTQKSRPCTDAARDRVRDLMNFIDAAPTAYQAADEERKLLDEAGYRELEPGERWHFEPGDKRYITLSDTAVIAFRVGAGAAAGFSIAGAHNDSPCFRIKAAPDQGAEGLELLNVEPYGGVILRTWLDRPLSVAGRVLLREGNEPVSRRVVIDRDWMIIPSLAIHMDREVNGSGAINPQKVMTALCGVDRGADKKSFVAQLAAELNVCADAILDYDLFLYARERGCFVGTDQELFSIGRIDNLGMAHALLHALIEAEEGQKHRIVVINNHEEVGSGSLSGADSVQLRNVLQRIVIACGGDEEDFLRSLSSSFLISCDQAHAAHPNYPEVADPTNRPRINGGPVIKIAASKSYSTDAESAARFRLLAEKAGVPVQTFHNRSDRRGGSTIGPITERWTAIPSVDVGNAMLSMHSVRELAGVQDHEDMIQIIKCFFEA